MPFDRGRREPFAIRRVVVRRNPEFGDHGWCGLLSDTDETRPAPGAPASRQPPVDLVGREHELTTRDLDGTMRAHSAPLGTLFQGSDGAYGGAVHTPGHPPGVQGEETPPP